MQIGQFCGERKEGPSQEPLEEDVCQFTVDSTCRAYSFHRTQCASFLSTHYLHLEMLLLNEALYSVMSVMPFIF
ncbi:hypothetical protein M514_17734 [Trichuris suis]|uniref:Uncharacterized protein n=1 Tax=Trichuris suis TaxID=68888 RepID=A0A085NKY6_9BILA|nr:hypothetical protein M514_17734 [Trichuris suis]